MVDKLINYIGSDQRKVSMQAIEIVPNEFAEAVYIKGGSVSSDPSPLMAGENHIGEVGSRMISMAVEFTRENNALPYSIGDTVLSSAATPVLVAFPNIFRVNGASALLVLARVVVNVKSVTPVLRLHFFNASNPVISGDNLQHQELYADTPKRLGYLELPAMETAANTASSDMSRSINNSGTLILTAASNSRNLYALLETRSALTLTALSKLTIALTLME